MGEWGGGERRFLFVILYNSLFVIFYFLFAIFIVIPLCHFHLRSQYQITNISPSPRLPVSPSPLRPLSPP